MFNVVLVNPEIPPNTGNIIRLCANTGSKLHIIKPCGFPLDNARMRRAGLDYHEIASLHIHNNWGEFLSQSQPDINRIFAFSTKTNQLFSKTQFQPDDWFVFGSETKGLSEEIKNQLCFSNLLRLPMLPNNRSLNLANSVAVTVYEAWRQQAYFGGI